MPNWCTNRLTVCGERDELARFKEAIRATDEYGQVAPLSFARICPHPPGLLEGKRMIDTEDGQRMLDAITGAETPEEKKEVFNRYPVLATLTYGGKDPGSFDVVDWQIAAWGTKWDLTAGDCRVTDDGDVIEYVFETAWSPPEPIVARLALRFPSLWFELVYSEPGVCIAGYVRYEGGQQIDREVGGNDSRTCASLLREWGFDAEAEMFDEIIEEVEAE